MKYEYFDIHSHLYFPDYDKDREEEIERMKKAKIGTIVIGTNFDSSQKAIELVEKHENLFACIGQHPEDLNADSVFDERLKGLAQHKKVVAIGECGLDYFRLTENINSMKLIQKTVFEHHAKIVGGKLRGNAHFFAGNKEILERFLAIGFTVSFTGVITFTHDYDELIKLTPLNMIMAETDAPFVAPVPHRGKRNSSLYMPEVVKRIAEVKNESLDKVKQALMANTIRQFNLVAQE